MIEVKYIKAEIEKIIKEADWKLETLSDKYFVDYFEETFLPRLKQLVKYLQIDDKGIK